MIICLCQCNWQGKDSSDEEELDDIPNDDQYDTEDSFIDDVELVGVLHLLAFVNLSVQFVYVG